MKSLTKIPVEVRAYIYHVAAIVAGTSFVASRFSSGDVQDVLVVLSAVLGIPSTTLAAANTPTNRSLRKRA